MRRVDQGRDQGRTERRRIPRFAVGLLVAWVIGFGPTTLRAQGESESRWGLGVGAGIDPDQIVGRVSFLETRLAGRLFLEPSAELGIGDDTAIVSGIVGFHYRFAVDSAVRPYAGGGPVVGFRRDDRKHDDKTELEVALRATGGILWRLSGGQEMYAELNLGVGDLRDAQIIVGWRF